MKKLLLLSCFCFLSQVLLAQLNTAINQRNYQQLKAELLQKPKNSNFSQQIQDFTFYKPLNTSSLITPKEQAPIPAAYAYKDLAFFCKIEVQLEKAVKLPVKFRLGSVDYVDYLEGKRTDY